MCVHVGMHLHTHMDVVGQLWVSSLSLSTLFFETASLIKYEAHQPSEAGGQMSFKDSLAFPPTLLWLQMCSTAPSFYVTSGDPSSGPHGNIHSRHFTIMLHPWPL